MKIQHSFHDVKCFKCIFIAKGELTNELVTN